MLTRRRLLQASASLPLVSAAGLPAQANTKELSFSNWLPPRHPFVVNALVPWAEELGRATNSAVRINFLPRAVSNPIQAFDAIRDGLADVTFIVHGYTQQRFPLTRLPEFPFMGDSAEAISVAYQRTFERHLAKANEHRGVRVLAHFAHGPGQIFTTNKPVRTPDDLRGMKIRVGGGTANDIGAALGISPIVKPAPESFEILSSGVADGIFFPLESTKIFRIDTVLKHVTLVPGGLYNVSFAVVMNPEAYNRLTADQRSALDQLSGEALSRRIGRAWDEADLEGRRALEAAGAQFITADQSFIRGVEARMKPLVDNWRESARRAGLDADNVFADFQRELRAASRRS